ncbi:hypothetical protein ABG067_006423 [Albugo candida]
MELSYMWLFIRINKALTQPFHHQSFGFLLHIRQHDSGMSRTGKKSSEKNCWNRVLRKFCNRKLFWIKRWPYNEDVNQLDEREMIMFLYGKSLRDLLEENCISNGVA